MGGGKMEVYSLCYSLNGVTSDLWKKVIGQGKFMS